MTFRVATFATTSTILSQNNKLQAEYADANIQTSSGLISQNFAGIASSTQQLLGLESQNNTLTSQALVMKAATIRVNTLQSTVSNISQTMNQVRTLFASVASGVDVSGGAASNVAQATTFRDDIVGLLNSKIGSDYLFSGSNYDAQPVNINAAGYTPSSSPTTANTNYYQGNGTIDSVRTSDTLTLSYGVTAANPAFENILRALTTFINDPTDPTVLSNAIDLATQATAGVATITGNLTAQTDTLSSQQTLNSSTADHLQSLISSLRDADVTQAAVTASQIDTQLQASYGATSKILSLRLSDYLK